MKRQVEFRASKPHPTMKIDATAQLTRLTEVMQQILSSDSNMKDVEDVALAFLVQV